MIKLPFMRIKSDHFFKKLVGVFKNYGLASMLMLLTTTMVFAERTLSSYTIDSKKSELIEDLLSPCCFAPADVTADCVALPISEIQEIALLYNTDIEAAQALLRMHFGNATSDETCTTDTIVERATGFDLNACGWGTITRQFEGWSWGPDGDINENGVLDEAEAIVSEGECTQIITITEGHDYSIEFPADIDVNEEGLDDLVFDLPLSNNGCDILAISASEPEFLGTLGEGACYKLAVTYDVVNWCLWDGESEGYTISRAANSGDHIYSFIDITERPILLGDNDGVIIDVEHPLPMSGEPDVLPDAYDCAEEVEVCSGRWTYTQHIRVSDDPSFCSSAVPCCFAPADVSVDCVDLSTDEIQEIVLLYNTDVESAQALLRMHFGHATSEDACMADTIVELATVFDLNTCAWGTITRQFESWSWGPDGDINENGVLDEEEAIVSEGECTQVITIIEGHDYSIEFPADIDVNEEDLDDLVFDLPLSNNGCDILAVSASEPEFLAPIGGEECYKLAVTYDVVNWCLWDGVSEGYTIPRQGNGGDNIYSVVYITERPILLGDNDGVIIDFEHPLPMSGEPDVLPEAYDCAEEVEVCSGRWKYTQHIRVSDDFSFCNGSSAPCPIMYVAMGSDRVRPCVEEEYQIQYCNIGGLMAEDAAVTVTIDPALTVVSASIPWTDQLDNTYTFDVNNLLPGECGNIQMTFIAPCDDPIGTTYCSEVYAYPDSTCIMAPDPEWDGAEIELSINCLEDSLMFNIQNVGAGDMLNPQEYIVIEDNVLLYQTPPTYQLDAGQAMSVTHPANGFFYYMRTQQSEGFPGGSTTVSWLEGCGTALSTNEADINQYPLGDQNSWHDVFCIDLVNSYDPNDKVGYPRGLGDQNYIDKNQTIEYIINFQNTGTAEALKVEIRDSIDLDVLDISTLAVGVGSHPYAWTVDESGFISFLFEGINLPYKDADEEGSQGFIKFTIDQHADLPEGTQIKNKAAIYFDHNPPIITNQTLHTIGKDYLATWTKEAAAELHEVLVYPNPISELFYIDINGLANQQSLQLELYDLLGNVLMTTSFENKTTPIVLAKYPAGSYFFKVYDANQLLSVGKLVKK